MRDKKEFEELFKNISSEYVSIYSVKDQKLIYNKQGDYDLFPASITKVMNAITALKYASVDLECVIGEEQDVMWRSPDPSLAHVMRGEKWKLGDLLYASLLPSGNDAAYAIGYNVINSMDQYKGLTVQEKCDTFARLMNEYALELGCKNTHFVTLDGNDYVDKRLVDHLTTSNDLCLIFNEALKYEGVVKVISTYKKEIEINGKLYKFENGNDLINPNSENYNPVVIGGKTGMTCPANYCLGSIGKKNGDTYIVICCYSYVNNNKYVDSNRIYKFLFEE